MQFGEPSPKSRTPRLQLIEEVSGDRCLFDVPSGVYRVRKYRYMPPSPAELDAVQWHIRTACGVYRLIEGRAQGDGEEQASRNDLVRVRIDPEHLVTTSKVDSTCQATVRVWEAELVLMPFLHAPTPTVATRTHMVLSEIGAYIGEVGQLERHMGWDLQTTLIAVCAVGGVWDKKFRVLYRLPKGTTAAELPPDQGEREARLRAVSKHVDPAPGQLPRSRCTEPGIAGEEPWRGSQVALSHVLAGIASGLQRTRALDMMAEYVRDMDDGAGLLASQVNNAIGVSPPIDNLYAASIAGDLGQVGYLYMLEKRHFAHVQDLRTLLEQLFEHGVLPFPIERPIYHGGPPRVVSLRPTGFTRHRVPEPKAIGYGTDATIAELIGDIDGFNIGDGIHTFTAKSLSGILTEYYGARDGVPLHSQINRFRRYSRFRERGLTDLREQTYRFSANYRHLREYLSRGNQQLLANAVQGIISPISLVIEEGIGYLNDVQDLKAACDRVVCAGAANAPPSVRPGPAAPAVATAIRWPCDGVVSSGFRPPHRPAHGALDIATAMGTPILAAAGGRVTIVAYEHKGYGHWVNIDHGSGFHTRYAHQSRVVAVQGHLVEQRRAS